MSYKFNGIVGSGGFGVAEEAYEKQGIKDLIKDNPAFSLPNMQVDDTKGFMAESGFLPAVIVNNSDATHEQNHPLALNNSGCEYHFDRCKTLVEMLPYDFHNNCL